jgi:hypothetical protein
MSVNNMIRTAGLFAIALMAMPLFASTRSNPVNTQVEKKSIKLDEATTVDGKTLKPGNYEVLIDGSKVSFEINGETVVTAPCNWKTMAHKSPYNSTTLSSKNVLQELQFEGSNQALDVL